MRFFPPAALLSLCLLSGAVHAQESSAVTPVARNTPSTAYDKLFYLEAQVASDGPLGIFGAAFGLRPFRNLALDFGVGIGRDGYRLGGGARLLFPMAEHGAFGLRAGIATGPLNWGYGTFRREWDSQVFFNADISYEYAWESLFFRAFIGVEQALGSTNPRCASESVNLAAPSVCTNAHPARPYVGLVLGYAFGEENARL